MKKKWKKNEIFAKYKILSTLLTLTNKIIFLQTDNNELKHIKIGLEMEIYII